MAEPSPTPDPRIPPRARHAPPVANRSSFFLFSDEQSAELESFRMAMRGLAGLACDSEATEPGTVTLERGEIAAVFDQMEKRLAAIVGPDVVKHGWFDPALVTGALQ